MSHKTSAMMYVGCHRGVGVDVPQHKNHGSMVVQYGFTALHCRSAEPPPATVYDRWLETQLRVGPRGQHGKAAITGEKLRRAVRMVRNGYSKAEAGRTNRIDANRWIRQLPPELAP